MQKVLRPYQPLAIEKLRHSLGSGRRRPLLQLPTGAGKTVIAAAIIEMARAKGKRVIFTVPALSLVDQTVSAFWNEGIRDIGVMQGVHALTRPDAPVQVASIQTLMRRTIPPADLVIIDEAHRLFDFVPEWMARPEWTRVPFVGLSATPWTKGLGKFYDDLIIPVTTAELIEAGYLSRFRVFAPSHPDLSGVKSVAGDFHEGQLSDAMQAGTLVADVVRTWLERGENRPTLCFAVDRAHAKHLQQNFEAAGVSCGYVDAYTTPEEREEVRRSFHDGELRVVCNVGVLTTGVDWSVGCIILARPTRSEMLFVQICGRGLRTDEAWKKYGDCLFLDHSDSTLSLGFVTDIHHDALDDGRERQTKEEKQVRLPKECPKCAYLRPVGVKACPSCGFEAQHVAANAETIDGKLVEVTPGAVKAAKDEKQTFWSELLGFAETYDKSRSWALAQFKEKHGAWPRGLRDDPVHCGPATYNWIKSRRIAYAKAMAKAAPSRDGGAYVDTR